MADVRSVSELGRLIFSAFAGIAGGNVVMERHLNLYLNPAMAMKKAMKAAVAEEPQESCAQNEGSEGRSQAYEPAQVL